MSRRRLELLRIARALDSARPPVEVRRRLVDALTAAADGGSVDDHLLTYTAGDLDRRDWRLSRACDSLPDLSWRQRLLRLRARATELEVAVVDDRIDIDRPGSWPPMPEWEEHLLHALAHGPMISQSRFYEQIVSGEGADRKPCESVANVQEAMDRWNARS